MHNILHEFKFWSNRTTDYGVSCPDGSQVSDRCPLGYLYRFLFGGKKQNFCRAVACIVDRQYLSTPHCFLVHLITFSCKLGVKML